MRNATAAGTTSLDIGAFVRALVHDVANPLNAIALNAELIKLLLDRRQAAQAREALEHVLLECERCTRLLQGYRSFGDGLKSNPSEIVSTRVVIAEAIELVRMERNEIPAIQIEQAEAQVRIDRLAVQGALAALVHNAADAGADTVHIATNDSADIVSIHVIDNGSGIPENLRDKVFEPFFSTRRAQGRSGLGLTLARMLLRAHGGELQIDPVERGTRMSVTLPAHR